MGIVPGAAAYGVVASFSSIATSKKELELCFKALSDTVKVLTSSSLPNPTNPQLPPPDNSILLGTQEILTSATMSVGVSIFDDRYGLASVKPIFLERMKPGLANDKLDQTRTHGDVLLILQGDHTDVPMHALRILMRATRKWLVLHWVQDTFNRPNESKTKGTVSSRNLLGFKDGTGNPDASAADLMDTVIWTDPADGEPGWTTGGSYQVVRMIRFYVEQWDRAPLGEQERIFGRHKITGAPLGQNKESDTPVYPADPDGNVIPLNSHIRLANPRDGKAKLILRRPMSYSRGVDGAGLLEQGLVFTCYQRTMAAFLEAQKRLKGEPLEEYIETNGGGFFFALPGPGSGYLGQSLLEA